MKDKNRLKPNTKITEAFIIMAEGNPGAITVLGELTRHEQAIDPYSALGGIGTMLDLDSHGVYGPRIWICYKDLCGQDIVKMIAVWRAAQLGIISSTRITGAISAFEQRMPQPVPLDVDDVLAKLRVELPRFGRNEADVPARKDTATP
jgi:hypothetical protein